MKPADSGLKSAVARKGSFLQTMGAVAWSFFGVRKSADQANDMSQLNPIHVVIGGVVGALVLIALLAMLVNWVLSSGIAA